MGNTFWGTKVLPGGADLLSVRDMRADVDNDGVPGSIVMDVKIDL